MSEKRERLASAPGKGTDEPPDTDQKSLAPLEASGNGEVVVRIVRQEARPLAVSELTCERVVSLPAAEWLPFLRNAKTAYRRHGELHIALLDDVETAIKAARRPGPARGTKIIPPSRKRKTDTEDHRELLEAAGFTKGDA